MSRFPYNPFDSSAGFGKQFIIWINKLALDIGIDIKEQKARLDVQINSIDQPNEVKDIRVDTKGNIHTNAKERVDSDRFELDQKIDETNERMGPLPAFLSFGSSIAEKAQNEFEGRGVSVQWFEADPTGQASSSQAFKDARDYAQEKGLGKIIIPQASYKLSEPFVVYSGMKVKGEHRSKSLIIPDEDFPAFTTEGYIDSSLGSSEIFIENLGINPVYATSKSAYDIEMINTFNSHIFNVLILGPDYLSRDDVSGIRFSKKSAYKGEHFVNSVLQSQLRHASIVMESTDSYMERNEVWAQLRSFAIHLVKSSQFLFKNQIVGSPVKGGLWIQDTLDDYDIEELTVMGNFFDGSYDDIDSGLGLNAYKLRSSSIVGNRFWRQMDGGLFMKNSHSNSITGNSFKDNNRRGNGSDDILLDSCAATTITSNTFKQEKTFSNKGSAVRTVNSPADKNIVTANTVYFISNYKDSSFSNKDIAVNNPGIEDKLSFVRSYLPTNVATNAGQETKIVFLAREKDNLNEYDYTNGAFIASQKGLYQISTTVTLDYQQVENRTILVVYKNGVGEVALQDVYTQGVIGIHGSVTLDLQEGDTISIYYYSSGNGTLIGADKKTWLSICKVG